MSSLYGQKVFKIKNLKLNFFSKGKMFTAGLDLKSASSLFTKNYGSQATTASIFLETVRKWQSGITAIAKCKKPVIAAIHNYCIGSLKKQNFLKYFKEEELIL